MKTKQQLLNEANILREKLAVIEKQIMLAEAKRMQKLAGMKNEQERTDELFGLGAKPKFKVGDAVYTGSANQIPKIVSKVLSGGKYEISPFTKKNPDGTYEYDETKSSVASEKDLNPYRG